MALKQERGKKGQQGQEKVRELPGARAGVTQIQASLRISMQSMDVAEVPGFRYPQVSKLGCPKKKYLLR